MEIVNKIRTYRIAIVDQDPLVLRGIMGFIEDESDFFVCGLFDCVEAAQHEIKELAPDLIVAEVFLPGMDGIELIRRLKLANPDVSILIVSRVEEALVAKLAIQTGAHGYVLKCDVLNEIVGAVRIVLNGGMYLSSTICEPVLNMIFQDLPVDASWPEGLLSGEELEVFQMIKTGLNTLEIADALVKSVNKVESHHECIKRKLNFEAKTALRRNWI